MTRTPAILALSAALLFAVLAVPGPLGPAPVARAHHSGELLCPEELEPIHDGVLHPGEYHENSFDARTKVLVSFGCVDDSARMMHVALVTPWAHWTELRVQAVEAWNGDMNVVRISGDAVEDGFVNSTSTRFVDDLDLGGSYDVDNPVSKRVGDVYVYEFGLPLLSQDSYDCQLAGNGSFYFQLAYVTVEGMDGQESALVESDPQVIRFGHGPREGLATSVELSLPRGSEAGEASEIIVGVRDETDAPLAARPVSVFARTAFGFLDLGTAYTNEQGVASVEYAPLGEGEFLIGAAFAGGPDLLASVSWLRLVVGPDGDSVALPQEPRFIETVIALVLGGVWVTFGYSFYIVRTALRDPRDRHRTGRKQEG